MSMARTSLTNLLLVPALLTVLVGACRPPSRASDMSVASTHELESSEEVVFFMRRAYSRGAESRLQDLGEWVDEEAFILGSGPDGGFSSREAWLRSLQPMLEAIPPGTAYEVTSKDLRIGLARGLRSAWVSDQLEVRAASAVGPPAFSVRILAVLTHGESGWRIVAGHGSFPIPNPVAQDMIRSGQLVRSTNLGSEVQRGADVLVNLYESGMANPSTLEETISDRQDVIAFGSAADEVHSGGAALKTAWRQFLEAEPRLTPIGGVRAGLSPDGELGWVASNVDIQIDEVRMPYRFFLVYLREPEGWRIVGWHDSYGLPAPI